MSSLAQLEPAGPILTAGLFTELGQELLALLRALPAAAWERGTVCPGWSVKDVAAHLLDTALRRLALERDGAALPAPDPPIASYAELVAYLNRLNAEWVVAARRLSPALLIELLEGVEASLDRHLRGLDPFAPALFGVAWAGEQESACWFDVARELTERWLHQAQIRLAVGAPPLRAPRFSRPVFETFARALPHRLAALEAPAGSALVLEIEGEETYAFTVGPAREAGAERDWQLFRGAASAASARARLSEETAWLLLTKGLPGPEARRRAEAQGDERLLEVLFGTLAVMA